MKSTSKFSPRIVTALLIALIANNSNALKTYTPQQPIINWEQGGTAAPRWLDTDTIDRYIGHTIGNNVYSVYNSSVYLLIKGTGPQLARAAGTIVEITQNGLVKYLLITAGHNLSSDLSAQAPRPVISPLEDYSNAPLPNITIISGHQIKNIITKTNHIYGENYKDEQEWAYGNGVFKRYLAKDLESGVYSNLSVTLKSNVLAQRAYGTITNTTKKDIAVFQLTKKEVETILGFQPAGTQLLSNDFGMDLTFRDSNKWSQTNQTYLQSGSSGFVFQVAKFSSPNVHKQGYGFTYITDGLDEKHNLVPVFESKDNNRVLAYRNESGLANYKRMTAYSGDSGGGLFLCEDAIMPCRLVAVDTGVGDNGLISVIYSPLSMAQQDINNALAVKIK